MPGQVYSNSVAARAGVFDVVLDFGFQPGDGSEPLELGVRVVMSWEHIGAMTRILANLVERYEHDFGSLPDIEKARIKEPQEAEG